VLIEASKPAHIETVYPVAIEPDLIVSPTSPPPVIDISEIMDYPVLKVPVIKLDD